VQLTQMTQQLATQQLQQQAAMQQQQLRLQI
jgi:hypothetical protein